MPRKPTPTVLTPSAMMVQPDLLAPYFQGPSWDRWRACLKAAFAERLTKREDVLFREVAGDRAPPTVPVREMWCIVGRRGGKDSVASAVAAAAALGEYPQLRPGERAAVVCIAPTRDQAALAFRYILGYFQKVPFLKEMITKSSDDTIELSNNTEIIVATNNFRGIRGRSVVVAILDECAFYRSDESANPDSELYAALVPAMQTFPNALLVGISTPYRRKGLLFNKWKSAFGQDNDKVLVVHGASRVFNETLDQAFIDEQLAEDEEYASAEYLAQWRNDLSDFLDRELVGSAVDSGVRARPPRHGPDYRIFVDSAGGRGDSFTAGVCHAEGDMVFLDAIYERRAPFAPPEVVKEVCDLARGYKVSRVTGDRYSADWVVSSFASEGIAYENSTRDRSMVYLDALPLFTSGRLRLLDNHRMVHQFVSLERRVSRFGKDGVNHPVGGADDLANAAAGAAVLASLDKRPALVRVSDTLHDGAPLPLPTECSMTVVVAMSKDGAVAVVYAALNNCGVLLKDGTAGSQMLVLDYEAGPLRPTFFADIRQRATELASVCCAAPWNTIQGWIDPLMHPAARGAGYGASVVPVRLATGTDQLLAPAAMAIGLGRVKVCEPAHVRALTSPWGGCLDFRSGDDAADGLRKAAIWSISLTLGLRT